MPHALPIKTARSEVYGVFMCSWFLTLAMAMLAVQTAMAAKPALSLRQHAVLRAKFRIFASVIPCSARSM